MSKNVNQLDTEDARLRIGQKGEHFHMKKTAPKGAVLTFHGKDQYFLDSMDSASARVISPALHRAMICTSLSLSL